LGGHADLHIREVRESDAEAIALILNGIIETGKYSALDTEVTAEAEQKSIAAFPSRGIFSVAEITENLKDRRVPDS
jgi:L-amino acid N-acyltransferase YncA